MVIYGPFCDRIRKKNRAKPTAKLEKGLKRTSRRDLWPPIKGIQADGTGLSLRLLTPQGAAVLPRLLRHREHILTHVRQVREDVHL